MTMVRELNNHKYVVVLDTWLRVYEFPVVKYFFHSSGAFSFIDKVLSVYPDVGYCIFKYFDDGSCIVFKRKDFKVVENDS